MAQTIVTSFTAYDLTEQEGLQGSILNTLQRQVMQNQLATIAEEKLRLEFNPEHPLLFAQREAELRGKLDLLDFLMEASETSNAILNNPNQTEEGIEL